MKRYFLMSTHSFNIEKASQRAGHSPYSGAAVVAPDTSEQRQNYQNVNQPGYLKLA